MEGFIGKDKKILIWILFGTAVNKCETRRHIYWFYTQVKMFGFILKPSLMIFSFSQIYKIDKDDMAFTNRSNPLILTKNISLTIINSSTHCLFD